VVMIDYFDSDGEPINGDKQYTEAGLKPGEIRVLHFSLVEGAKTYRVWVTEIQNKKEH